MNENGLGSQGRGYTYRPVSEMGFGRIEVIQVIF